jgi:hypothetical protein
MDDVHGSTAYLVGKVAVIEVGLDLEGLEGFKVANAEVSSVFVSHRIQVSTGVMGLIEVVRLLDHVVRLHLGTDREFFDVLILELRILKTSDLLAVEGGV